MAPRLLILAVLFFVAATAVYTFPLARHPGSLLLAGVGDHPSEAALIGWTARQLLHAPGHLFDTEFFYPHSHTEAYWQSLLVPGILAMPVMAATGDALLATNTVVLLALVLSGLLTAGLASSLTHRAIPSLLAGAVFAFFPNRLEHLNSPMVQMGFLLPAILWAYIRFLEEARWRHLLVLVLALWGQIFSSLYYAFAAGFLLLAIGLGWLLLRPDTMSWRLVGRGALGVGGLALAAGPFLAPYLTVLNRPRGTALFHLVYTYVPGAAAFRAPGRWALVLVLPLALLAAIGLAAMIDRLPRWARGLVPAGVLAAVLIELLPHPIPWQERPPVPPAHRWLAGQPGDFAVAALPARDGRHAAWTMLWATTHWKRLVNGAFVFVPPTVQVLADEEDPVDADALVATLQSIYPLRYVILNRPLLSPAETAAWERIHHDPGRGIAFVGRFGEDDLYAVAGAPQQGAVLRRWFSADFVRRHPRAEYVLTLAGAEPEASRRVEVRFNGRLLATHDGPARGAVDLEPPYRAGDRNELSFTHVYTIEPGAISTLAYRIGTTGVHAPVDIAAISGARPYGNRASIRVNGQELVEGTPRGYVVAALDPRDGRPMRVDSFDTFLRAGESRRMARLIESLPSGTIVVAAARDEASGQLEETAVRALRSVGAREDLRGRPWVSHVVIGVKGAEAGQAVEAAGPALLRASVGRGRPLETVLESFELR